MGECKPNTLWQRIANVFTGIRNYWHNRKAAQQAERDRQYLRDCVWEWARDAHPEEVREVVQKAKCFLLEIRQWTEMGGEE